MDHAVLTPIQIPYTDINMLPLYGVALVFILWALSTTKRYMLMISRTFRFLGRGIVKAYYYVIGGAMRFFKTKL
jgi:hypothetical protein